MFFFKCSKFYVDLKNEIKFQQKVFGFLDSVWDSFFIVKEFRYLHFFLFFATVIDLIKYLPLLRI